jgi:hypothetical protein
MRHLVTVLLAVLMLDTTAAPIVAQASAPQAPQKEAKPESQSAAKPEIITGMTLEGFQSIVQAMGFGCTRDKDDKGKLENFFIYRAEGYKVVAQVPAPGYIYLSNLFTAKLKPELVNEWNSTNNFSRAYYGPEALTLDAEIIIQGGVTRDYIEEGVKTFRTSVVRWARFILDHDKDVPPPSTSKPDHQGQ